MIRTGLVSITFRSLTPARVAALAAEAGLEAIEWGGDIHVPHGDVAAAREVARLTREAGLAVAAYGSYYRLAAGAEQAFDFDDVLSTALALGAPSIRVWAGDRGSDGADEAWRARATADARRIAEAAAREGVLVCLEYHARTLTDTCDSAIRLLREADHPNLRTLWQPEVGGSPERLLEELRRLAPWLEYVHAYHWEGRERHPFAEGEDVWRRYLNELSALPGDRFALLEFVAEDDPARLAEDAAALKRFASGAAGGHEANDSALQ
ncbi:TIM barrel protein [Paenibacillus antri]|uniref:TIM barrel protein n=1 Tax=Paenibacillus antri TaxID=2582848 RepID=A0A5R9FYW4_9BACL|nr:TIM barrel protein [Paenibacillus antri]TLS49242.1 TIM barrel protein [Paenibacillus antri]